MELDFSDLKKPAVGQPTQANPIDLSTIESPAPTPEDGKNIDLNNLDTPDTVLPSPVSPSEAASAEEHHPSGFHITIQDIGNTAVDVGKAVVKGGIDSVNAAAKLTAEAGLAQGGQWMYNSNDEEQAAINEVEHGPDPIQVPDQLEPQTAIGKFAEPVAQFMLPYLGELKMLKLLSIPEGVGVIGKAAQGLAVGGTTMATFFDSSTGRISDLINNYVPALKGPWSEYLASDPTNAAVEGRFKNFIDSAVGGVAAESLFATLRGFRGLMFASKSGSPEALKQAVDTLIPDVENGLDAIFPNSVEKDAAGNATLKTGVTESTVQQSSSSDVLLEANSSHTAEGPPPEPGTPTPKVDTSGAKEYATELQRIVREGGNPEEIDLKKYINVNTFTDPQTVSDSFEALVRTTKNELYNKGTITHQMTNEAAAKQFSDTVNSISDITGKDKGSISALLTQDAQNVQDAMVRAVVTKNIMGALGDEAYSIAVDAADLNPQALEKLAKIKEAWQTIQGPYSTLRSASGRLLNSYGIKDAMTKDASAILSGDADLVATAKELQQAKSHYGAMKAITGAADMVLTYRVNAMLSGPLTHAINVASTGLKVLTTPLEDAIGAVIKGDKDSLREAQSTFLGYMRFLGDAGRMAGTAWRRGEPIITESSQLQEFAKADPFTSGMTVDKNSLISQGLKWLAKGPESVITLPSRFLNSEDEFFKQLVYRSRLDTDLTRQGLKQGLTGQELAAWKEQAWNNSFSESGAGLNKGALEEAKYATFTGDLTDETFVNNLSQFIEQAHNSDNMVMRYASRILIPFNKTPAKIIQDIIDHTPVAGQVPGVGSYANDFWKGGEYQQRAIGHIVTGSTFWAIGLTAAASGRITGAGPNDPAIQKQLRSKGWQPYSLRVDNPDGSLTFIPLTRLDPWGSYLAMAADGVDAFKSMSTGDSEDAFKHAVIGIANNMSSKKYLTGLIDVMDIVSGSTYGDPATKALNSMSASMVPSILAQFKNDPYQRVVRNAFDAALNKVPGWSKHLPAKRDFLGNPVLGAHYGLYTNVDKDPVTKEIFNLSQQGAHFSAIPNRIGKVDLDNFRAADGKFASDRLGELMQEELHNGSSLNDKLGELIKSPMYQKALPPFEVGQADYQGGKDFMIKKVVIRYRDEAIMKALINEDFKNSEGQSLKDAVIADKVYQQSMTQTQLDQGQNYIQNNSDSSEQSPSSDSGDAFDIYSQVLNK